MRVSIVIPCFNGQPYLRSAIQSALAQSMREIEVIIVDNCSTDGSYEEATTMARGDARVRVTRNERNLGMAGNWNRAITEASGEFVKVLCADDLLEPEGLESQLETFAAHPELSVVTSPSFVISKDGERLARRYPPFVPERAASLGDVVRKCLLAGTNVVGETSVTLFRRSAMERTGKFDESLRYLTDLDYTLALLRYGKLGVTERFSASYRVHPGAETNVSLDRTEKEMSQVFRKHSDGDADLWKWIEENEWRFRVAAFAKRHAKRAFIGLSRRRWGVHFLRWTDALRSR